MQNRYTIAIGESESKIGIHCEFFRFSNQPGHGSFKVTLTFYINNVCVWYIRIDCARYLIVSKLEQGGCRIRSRRQYEDERRTAVGVSKCFAKVKWRWLNKPLAKLSGNKVLDCGRHLK